MNSFLVPGPGPYLLTHSVGCLPRAAREALAAAGSRECFAPGELQRFLADVPEAVVRAAAGVAYTRDPQPSVKPSQGDSPDTRQLLLERIQQELDPRGVFAA